MSVKTHKEGEGMTSYKTDSYICTIHKKDIEVINLTPVYTPENRNNIKRVIEKQLYKIFCKYVSH